MGRIFAVTYVRRPTDSDAHWLTVVTAMQVGLVAVLSVVCRLVTGEWWHPLLWMPPAVGVIGIAWGLRDRALARRQFDRQVRSDGRPAAAQLRAPSNAQPSTDSGSRVDGPS